MTPPAYQPPERVRSNQQTRALARRPQPCGVCNDWQKTALYPCGWRCAPCATATGLQLPNERTPA